MATPDEANSLVAEYQGTCTIVMEISPLDENGWATATTAGNANRSTLAHGMKPAFSLELNNGKQLRPVVYHYEGPAGPNPNHRFVLGFPNEAKAHPEALTLHYNDATFGGGLLHFQLEPDCPQIPDFPKNK